jgi:uncharacterized membrane protein
VKVLLDCSVITHGGALQSVVSFISNAVMDSETDWLFILNDEISIELSKLDLVLSSDRCLLLKDKPARFRKVRAMCLEYQKKSDVDMVSTYFGPSYIKVETHYSMQNMVEKYISAIDAASARVGEG